MTCCDILRINGMVTHEIGCPNQGQIVTKHRYPKYYVGIRKNARREVIKTALEANRYYFPEFVALIGPFKTKRGATWGAENPCGWSHVSEAEQKAAALRS